MCTARARGYFFLCVRVCVALATNTAPMMAAIVAGQSAECGQLSCRPRTYEHTLTVRTQTVTIHENGLSHSPLWVCGLRSQIVSPDHPPNPSQHRSRRISDVPLSLERARIMNSVHMLRIRRRVRMSFRDKMVCN